MVPIWSGVLRPRCARHELSRGFRDVVRPFYHHTTSGPIASQGDNDGMTSAGIRKLWKARMIHSPIPGRLMHQLVCWMFGHPMEPIEIEIRPCGSIEGFYRCKRCGRRGYSLG